MTWFYTNHNRINLKKTHQVLCHGTMDGTYEDCVLFYRLSLPQFSNDTGNQGNEIINYDSAQIVFPDPDPEIFNLELYKDPF